MGVGDVKGVQYFHGPEKTFSTRPRAVARHRVLHPWWRSSCVAPVCSRPGSAATATGVAVP